jgi:hypothetical protein
MLTFLRGEAVGCEVTGTPRDRKVARSRDGDLGRFESVESLEEITIERSNRLAAR